MATRTTVSTAVPSHSIRWWVLALAALPLLLIAGTARAQSPRFGTDTTQLRMTMTLTSNSSAMGMAVDMKVDMLVLTTMRITQLSRDTLHVRAVVDSVTFSMKSAMLDAMGAGGGVQGPVKKGDTSVFLMSPRGKVLRKIAGGETIQMLTGGSEFPADLRPGMSWDIVPPALASGADPAMSAMFGDMSKMLEGTTKMTYSGVVNRNGTNAWRFITEGSAADKPLTLPTGGTGTLKELRIMGNTFVDTRGRILASESTSRTVMEMNMGGNVVGATSTATITIDRVR